MKKQISDKNVLITGVNSGIGREIAVLLAAHGARVFGTVRNLRPLERDGLIESKGGGHGVPVEIFITAKGRKHVEEFTPAWRTAQARIIDTLGEEQWSSLLDQLEKAAERIRK